MCIYNCNGFGSTANKQRDKLSCCYLAGILICTPGIDFFHSDKISFCHYGSTSNKKVMERKGPKLCVVSGVSSVHF